MHVEKSLFSWALIVVDWYDHLLHCKDHLFAVEIYLTYIQGNVSPTTTTFYMAHLVPIFFAWNFAVYHMTTNNLPHKYLSFCSFQGSNVFIISIFKNQLQTFTNNNVQFYTIFLSCFHVNKIYHWCNLFFYLLGQTPFF